MCGIAGAAGDGWTRQQVEAMVEAQVHRGPDENGTFFSESEPVALASNRLRVIDLSPAGDQPKSNADGTLWIAFNGEIYNHIELRSQLRGYSYDSHSDTEVVLAAYEAWGEACLSRLLGMFAFLLWDGRKGRLLAARDRFGVKPLYYRHDGDGTFFAASEPKALHAAGTRAEPDAKTWATYLAYGLYDHSERTFWKGIKALPAGHLLTWEPGRIDVRAWYDLADAVGTELDLRPEAVVREEYRALLEESVGLRFRSDVPVGVNLSGGLDSSALLGLIHAVQGPDSDVKAFTFVTGDPHYDELPWARRMLAGTRHPAVVCPLNFEDVPELALSVQHHQDEPFGGIPTLAYARVFEAALQEGVTVLLDGQGMDEQWAGYDYYGTPAADDVTGPVQGSEGRAGAAQCLVPEFRSLAVPLDAPRPFSDPLRDRQYLDARFAKIPRALRFNDRISMRSSRELREPFLDHRLFELALRQPPDRKISNGRHKRLLRDITREVVDGEVVEAPKRPVQTPQREWLRGPLRDWADGCIGDALASFGNSWFDEDLVLGEWASFLKGEGDSSFHVWQWVNLGLWETVRRATRPTRDMVT